VFARVKQVVFFTLTPAKQVYPMGEARKDAFRVEFDRSIKFEFHGSTISSDGGLLAYRELD